MRACVYGNVVAFTVANVIRNEKKQRRFDFGKGNVPALYDVGREYAAGRKWERGGKFYAVFL
jgi:hypothetical protein